MRGSIIETACNIDMNSRDQTVDFGVVPVGEILRNGHSHIIPFTIKLVNCTLKKINSKDGEWKGFNVTFDGQYKNELFINHSNSIGVGVALYDNKFNRAIPGVSFSPYALKNGSNDIEYYLSLEVDGEKVKAGDFNTSIKYKIDYF